MKLRYCLILCLVAVSCRIDKYVLSSPDGRTSIAVTSSERLEYTVICDGDTVVPPSAISMEFVTDNLVLGRNPGKMRVRYRSLEEHFSTALCYRQASFTEKCNEARLGFDGWTLTIRAYDSGVAWRFETNGCVQGNEAIVRNEIEEFSFPPNRDMWVAYSIGKDPYANSFQNDYTWQKVGEFGTASPVALLPIAVDCGKGMKAVICESDLESYPGMFIKKSPTGLVSDFAKLPDSTVINPYRCQEKVTTRKDHIARTVARRTYPWRIIAISREDKELPVNNLVYALARPMKGKAEDWSWVKPGLCAWEWWNNYGLENTDFEPGVNTPTYKEYIDFASEYGLPYVIIDEGWSKIDDVTAVREGLNLDLEEIISYASSKNVGVFLWAVANVLDNKLEEACAKYSAMGVKGFKVDFFDRDDQLTVEMVYRICSAAAKYMLMVDLHGIYKPTGLNRTFPNVVNFEGVYGLEEVKWASPASVEYDVTFPFIRQIQGPSDYTQGAYRNATEETFRIDYNKPMSKGTRARQVGAYIVFDSPLAMLCDSPSLYRKEKDCTSFIASIPTVFDRTEVIAGEIGSYIITAREKDGVWYVGALTDWNAREISLPLDFLKSGIEYTMSALIDAEDSGVNPEKYLITTGNADNNAIFVIRMAPGGGAALIFTPKS